MFFLNRYLCFSATHVFLGTAVSRKGGKPIRRKARAQSKNITSRSDLAADTLNTFDFPHIETNIELTLEPGKEWSGDRTLSDQPNLKQIGKTESVDKAVHPFIAALRKKTAAFLPRSTTSEAQMVSGVTRTPFSPRAQIILRRAAKKEHYSSKYWITQAQARRTANAVVLPGQKSTSIFLHVEHVIKLNHLPKATQRRVLDEHPPFFGSGVGILTERFKWMAVTSERLIQALNPKDDERALYIDVDLASDLGLKYNPKKDVVDIREESRILVYNAEQLDDPYKAEPQKGIALNAITGKRVGQPAHDILLGVGLLRGYISPMWVSERQLKYLNLELRPGVQDSAVAAPNMTGLIVCISALPLACQRELLSELKKKRVDGFGRDLYFLYSVNGWEVTRAKGLVKHMMGIHDSKYPYHFVNVRDLALQKPHYAAFLTKNILKGKSPLSARAKEPNGKTSTEADPKQNEPDKLFIQHFRSRKIHSFSYFFAEDVTLRRYYNAVCTTAPYLVMPTVRSVAIVDGRLVGRRDESVLRAFALKNKLSSPIWLTESLARRLGVHVLPRFKNHYVRIGSGAADGESEETSEGFYNIEDFLNPDEILSLFPKASKQTHFMLDAKWRPIIGKQKQEFLSSLGRKSPLWVSVNECLMSGFEPIEGTVPHTFPLRSQKKSGKKKDGEGGTRLYNSQYTSDPVRVIGLSTVLTRPQGLHL